MERRIENREKLVVIKMVLNEVEQTHLSGLTVEDVMNYENKDLDLLLEDVRSQIEKKRIDIEQRLEIIGDTNKDTIK